MKKLLFAVFILTACSNNRNELMTKLINEKKEKEDEYVRAKLTENKFNDIYMNTAKDSTATYFDSVKKYMIISMAAKERMQQLDFSIDSLQKMK